MHKCKLAIYGMSSIDRTGNLNGILLQITWIITFIVLLVFRSLQNFITYSSSSILICKTMLILLMSGFFTGLNV